MIKTFQLFNSIKHLINLFIIINKEKMNSDSFFDSDFLQENKAILTILTTVSLAFFTIYWLYRGLKPEEYIPNQNSQNRNLQNNIQNNFNYVNNYINQNNLNNSVNNQNNIVNSDVPKANNKRRLLINASSVLIENMENFDIGKIYQFLSPLSEIFDLYMVFLIKDNSEVQQITEKMEVLIEDKIIYKHVKL